MVHVVHGVQVHLVRILRIVLLHDLEVHLVVHLEALGLDLLLPIFIVDLDVVKNGVDEHSNVWIFVGEKLKDDGDHLRLVQDHIASGTEEQELEEGVQDLLHHLIILLL